QQLLKLCKTHHIQNVHTNIELGINELKRDTQAQKLLELNGIGFELYHDRTLFMVGNIRNKSGQPYQVFGAFKKQCYEQLSISISTCYPSIKAQPPIALYENFSRLLPSVEANYPDKHISEEQQKLSQEGKHHACSILDDFIKHRVSHYHLERDFPA